MKACSSHTESQNTERSFNKWQISKVESNVTAFIDCTEQQVKVFDRCEAKNQRDKQHQLDDNDLGSQ